MLFLHRNYGKLHTNGRPSVGDAIVHCQHSSFILFAIANLLLTVLAMVGTSANVDSSVVIVRTAVLVLYSTRVVCTSSGKFLFMLYKSFAFT